jgi:hypothetical protein
MGGILIIGHDIEFLLLHNLEVQYAAGPVIYST